MASNLMRLPGFAPGVFTALVRGRLGFHRGALVGLTMLCSIVLLFFTGTVDARTRSDDVEVVALGEMPTQAQSTYRLILSGGPFRYAHKDGAVFGNRERQLPRMARGYYREYTVETPGSWDRGARRIVCGGNRPTNPDDCYYTQDHYTSFRRIVP